MRSQLLVRRIFVTPARYFALGLALAAAIGVTSCSSSSSTGTAGSSSSGAAPSSSAPSSTAPTSASAAAPEPTSGSTATAAIKTNWEAFFSGKTSAATKISLLQNGQAFASIINNQAGSSLSASASATVTQVTLKSGAQAAVKYNIGVSGASLNNQNGTSVYQNGKWVVADVSFCQLLTLENGGTPPSVCKSAG
jgi:hypothetical protein